jgi:hypothetical protein
MALHIPKTKIETKNPFPPYPSETKNIPHAVYHA